MNQQELENALLLLESGELSKQDAEKLKAYLAEHPEAEALQNEFTCLQHAGRFASAQLVPPVSEVQMEHIRAAAHSHPPRTLHRALAVAAGILLLVASWPLIAPSFLAPSPFVSSTDSDTLSPSDPSLSDAISELEQELSAWKNTTPQDLLQLAEEEFWAEQLLTTGDSI